MADDFRDDYRYGLALYRHGSIAAAARALHVNDTTVARRLSHVECSLGTRLFERERGRDCHPDLLMTGAAIDWIADALASLYPELARPDAPAATPSRELWMLLQAFLGGSIVNVD